MLSNYLNQTCELQRKTDTDQRGRPVYAASTTIPCRLEEKYQLITKPNGETVPAHHICYSSETISVDDKVNGLIVHYADKWVDLDGDTIGYKAVM